MGYYRGREKKRDTYHYNTQYSSRCHNTNSYNDDSSMLMDIEMVIVIIVVEIIGGGGECTRENEYK